MRAGLVPANPPVFTVKYSGPRNHFLVITVVRAPPKIYEDEEVVVIKRYSVDEIAEIILEVLAERGGVARYSELESLFRSMHICGSKGFDAAVDRLLGLGRVEIVLDKKRGRYIVLSTFN